MVSPTKGVGTIGPGPLRITKAIVNIILHRKFSLEFHQTVSDVWFYESLQHAVATLEFGYMGIQSLGKVTVFTTSSKKICRIGLYQTLEPNFNSFNEN